MEKNIQNKLTDFFNKYPKTSVKKYEHLIKPGDSVQKIFYLESGYIRLYTVSISCQEFSLNIFDPSSFFPISSVLANNKTNSFYFQSLTQALLRRAPTTDVLNFLENNHDVSYDLLKRLSSGFEGLLTRIDGIIYTLASQKIASTLYFLSQKYGVKDKNNIICISFLHTHATLATLAGLTRETTSREMKKLENKKIIKHANKKTCVLDLQALKALAITEK